MPAASEPLVGAAVGRMLLVPFGKPPATIATGAAVVCGYFELRAAQVARYEDRLRERLTDLHVYRPARLAEDEIHRARIPVGFDQPGLDTEDVAPVHQGREERVDRIRCAPDIGQVQLEEMLLVLAVEEADAGLHAG